MKVIKNIRINIPQVNQEFELGDLTIFIGRSNCGKTRILTEIYNRANEFNKILQRHKKNPPETIRKRASMINIELEKIPSKFLPVFIPAHRTIVNTITTYNTGLTKLTESSKKIDPTIEDFGNSGIKQDNENRSLNMQGSGIQNIMQIIPSINHSNDFVIIDEPEASQFPHGKIEVLRRLIELLEEKQVLFATHDPTLINQYLIKKLIKDKDYKIIIYSFCGDLFKKIDFNCIINPEIHCGYLSQTFSGKPIHLIVEGPTEFYSFQSLFHKFLSKKNKKFLENFNKISISHIAGGQWKINVHHLPPPEYYSVLLVLDNCSDKNVDQLNISRPYKVINSIKEFEDGKLNILFLNVDKIEKAFEGIFEEPENIPKPTHLSWHIWNCEEIIEKLNETSDNSKQIYDIVQFIISKSY